MTASLEIRLIRNANPSWARTDIGPLDELLASIKKRGIKKPILLTPDFLVIDGARRIVAAESLGMDVVPIIICHTWADVMVHFRPVAEDCHPMDWNDLVAFWYNVLSPIHRRDQHLAATATRRSGLAATKKPVYSGFLVDMAALYNTTPSTIKTVRDYMNRLSNKVLQYPLYVQGVLEIIPRGRDAGDLTLINALKTTLENLVNGVLTEEEALDIFQRRINGEHVPKVRRTHVPSDARNMQTRTFTDLLTFVELLENLSHEAAQFHVFAVSPQEHDKIVARMRAAITPISRMRKRLTAAAIGESKEEEV